MSNGDPTERRLLRSWKSIAAYLGVDVRTAQRWHKRTPLPLHRPSHEHSHPVVYADDLDRWVRESDSRPEPPVRDRHRARPPLAWIALLASAGVIVAAITAFRWTRAGPPHRAHLQNGVVTVVDARDRVRWRAPLDGAVGEPMVHDVDGDGAVEVLVDVQADAVSGASGRLVCFDAQGRQRWSFSYGRPRTWYGRDFSATYGGKLVRAIRTRNGPAVLAVAWHSLWFPAQVALLDGRSGALTGEYWHPGGLDRFAAADLDGDGFDEVLLGGINNPGRGLGHGVVAVLDVPFAPRERAYLAFPRPDACSALGQIPFVNRLMNEGGHVVATVACEQASWVYTFDRALGLVDVRPSDNVDALHRRLQRQGLLDHAFDGAEEACLKRVARFPTAPDGNGAEVRRLWARCE